MKHDKTLGDIFIYKVENYDDIEFCQDNHLNVSFADRTVWVERDTEGHKLCQEWVKNKEVVE